MGQSDSEQLSLRFEPALTAAPSLQLQLQQLLSERGALRNITQQSLQTEIDQTSFPDPEPSNSRDGRVDSDVEYESPQARQERIWKAREETLQKLSYAQNEVLSALDFISLLLSKTSQAAQNSMSPALKQHVPVGTLESDMIEQADTNAAEAQRLIRVSEGWKSDSFQSACNKFSQAADRLDGEAQRQNRYWDQIASFKAHGWSISRLPSDSRAISVHYGFPEAASQFRKRGVAVLQQDNSGNLLLDPRSVPEIHMTTKISIVHNGVETGVHELRLAGKFQEDSVEEQLCRARDALFEQELFYEVYREARLIANQGVRTRSHTVEASIGVQTYLRVSQVHVSELQLSSSGDMGNAMAEFLGVNLRLLLLLEHTKARLRRSSPPPAMSHTPRVTPEYALLRPLLAHLRQQASVSAFYKISKPLTKVCDQAGLQLVLSTADSHVSETSGGMQRLRQPVRCLLNARLENGRKVAVEVETYLGSPIYGTVFRSTVLDFGFVTLQASSFDTADEAAEYLAHVLTLELMSQTKAFEVLRPHSGEVVMRATGKVMAAVSVRPQRISLLVSNPVKTMHMWRLSGYHSTPHNSRASTSTSFGDVVSGIVQ